MNKFQLTWILNPPMTGVEFIPVHRYTVTCGIKLNRYTYSHSGFPLYMYPTTVLVSCYTSIQLNRHAANCIPAYKYTIIPVRLNVLPLYHYTVKPLYRYTGNTVYSILLYRYTSILLYRYTSILLYRYTSILLYRSGIPLYHYTVITISRFKGTPSYRYAGIVVHHYTVVPFYWYTGTYI